MIWPIKAHSSKHAVWHPSCPGRPGPTNLGKVTHGQNKFAHATWNCGPRSGPYKLVGKMPAPLNRFSPLKEFSPPA